jgi:hypothetical protein
MDGNGEPEAPAPRPTVRVGASQASPPPKPSPRPPQKRPQDHPEMKKLQSLRDAGILTEQEFQAARDRLLASAK